MNRRYLLVLCAALLAAGCKHKLEGEKSPSVNADQVLTYCGSEQQSFVIEGVALSPMVVDGATKDADVKMPDVCMTKVEELDGSPATGDNDEVCIPEEDVQWVSQDEIRFTMRRGIGVSPGVYDVIVRNPDGTEAKGSVRLTVLAEGPQVFWSDPSVVYNGIATQITLYGSLLEDVQSVTLRSQDDREPTELTFQEVGTRENKVMAVVPAGIPVAAGEDAYDIVVNTGNGCSAELLRGLEVTDTVDLVVSLVDPLFGYTGQATAVTVTGEGFQSVPRVYLNPPNPDETTVAPALASVAVVNDTTLTAVVPGPSGDPATGLPVGDYQLIVVNPDGHVGILDIPGTEASPDLFKITGDPPPVIANVSPNYLEFAADQPVTIEGSDFVEPSVTLACRDPDGNDVPTLTGSVLPGGSSSAFGATLPVRDLTQGTVCVVRVTNADGSYSDYSAVGISNSSGNLNVFLDAPDLAVARRAPAVASGRATRAARFLYAIGGDDGTASGALTSVETATIDIYGQPAPWFTQPVALPSPRTLAGVARVGRFLYLVGGNDGEGPTTDVLRAEILDPLAAPSIVDITARSDEDVAGLGQGVWYYRVAAVMGPDDPSNPGGETLASDPIAVDLSDRPEPLTLTLYWSEVPGALGYRIYRSPTGTETIDGVRLIAEVTGTADQPPDAFFEDQNASADPNRPPRPLGATGEWATLPALSTAREAPGVAAAPDPADPTVWYVYAIGGRGAAELDSVERLAVTIAADGSQSVVAWTAGAAISAARSELTAYSVSHSEAAQIPAGTVYIYAGGGMESSDVDVAQVAAGGELAWASTQAMTPLRAGYAGVAGAGYLFAFGGPQSSPDNTVVSGQIDDGVNVPELVNWNSEGVQMLQDRYLSGGAAESACIYIVGGVTAGDVPTASVERTVL